MGPIYESSVLSPTESRAQGTSRTCHQFFVCCSSRAICSHDPGSALITTDSRRTVGLERFRSCSCAPLTDRDDTPAGPALQGCSRAHGGAQEAETVTVRPTQKPVSADIVAAVVGSSLCSSAVSSAPLLRRDGVTALSIVRQSQIPESAR